MASLTKRISISILLIITSFSPCLILSKSTEDPTPTPWPHQFHSILLMNYSGSLQVIDLWYDWINGRNFNIIQHQLGKLLYDLEWNNGTSFFYTLDSNKECRTSQLEVGILRPNWLDGAKYLGQQRVDGFLCNVWEKVDFIWYYEDVVTNRPVHWVFYTGTMSGRGKRKEEEEYGSDENAPPKKASKSDATDDSDDIVVCEISKNRRVSVRNWQGKVWVDIREFYVKDGKTLPGKKGISLNVDQWNVLRDHVEEIDKALAENN